MIVVTTPDVTGSRVTRMLGMVRGSSIRTRHVGRDIMAVFRNLAGGEIPEYTKMLAEAREQAVDRMVAEAQQNGANAITNVRFATSYIMGAASEIMAYGNGVVTEPE